MSLLKKKSVYVETVLNGGEVLGESRWWRWYDAGGGRDRRQHRDFAHNDQFVVVKVAFVRIEQQIVRHEFVPSPVGSGVLWLETARAWRREGESWRNLVWPDVGQDRVLGDPGGIR